MAIRARFHTVRSFDGTELAWASSGTDGTAVILANGIVCSDTYWTYLYPHLAEHSHRVVFWDYRGHGRSGPPVDDAEITLSAHARDLWAVADAAGVERAVLVGHSMGVQTILEAYRLAPERVAGLVPIAGAYEDPASTFMGVPVLQYVLPLLQLSVRPVPWLSKMVWRTLAERDELLYWSGRVSQMIGASAPRELMTEYFRHIAGLDPALAIRMATSLSEHSARDLLPTIDVPTLVLAGAKDVMTPPKLAEEMADAIPGARLEVHPDGSHTLPVDDPGWVDDLVCEFVTAVGSARRPARRTPAKRPAKRAANAPTRRTARRSGSTDAPG